MAQPSHWYWQTTFNSGLTGWTGQAGNVQTLAAAAMGNTTGQGLAANLAPAALTVATDAVPAYVSDQKRK